MAKLQEAVKNAGAQEIGAPVTSDQIDAIGKLQDIQERGRHHRTIIKAWKDQQEQDRKLRKWCANWLMGAMCLQVIAIYIIFVLETVS